MEKEDVLTCELCNEGFTDPRCLPCLHTFCKKCIEKSLQERVGKASPDDYFCPACYAPSHITNKAGVSQLPVNHLVASLSEANDIKHAYPKCISCSRTGKSTKAVDWCRTCHESLCEKCSGIHGSLKATMKHNIMSLEKAKQLKMKEIVAPPTCQDHEDQSLTQYCEDHDQAICDSCAGSKHRKCHYIKPIGVMARSKENESLTTMGSLHEQTKKAKNTLDERQKSLTDLENSKRELLNKIKSVKKSMNDILTRHEKQILNELEVIHSHEKTAIEGNIWEAKTVYKATNNSAKLLKQASENGSDAHHLQWLEKVKARADQYDQDLRSLRHHLNRTTIEFTINRQLDDVMRTLKNLGDLNLKQSAVHSKNAVTTLPPMSKNKESSGRRSREKRHSASLSIRSKHSHRERIPSPKEQTLPEYTFSARSPSDMEPCWITGIAVLPSEQWVFTDRANYKIKLFGVDYKLKSERHLDIAPFDVAVLSTNEIAVSIPDGYKVEVYSVVPGINLLRVISLDERCYGISYSGSRFAVACAMASYPAIKIISYDGEEKYDICPKNGQASLFLRPWYVKWGVTGKNILITDCNKSQVIGITGTVIKNFTYAHDYLKSPRGITLCKDGGFYVCGWGSDNVHYVDASGKFVKELLCRRDGIIGPQTICLSVDQQRLVLSLDSTSGNSDEVQVFRT